MTHSSRAFPTSSSASHATCDRPKSLGVHAVKIAVEPGSTRPAKSQSHSVESSQPDTLDSANMLAARRLLQARNEAGLTQEEAAYLTGESRKQVHKRESNKVRLGALRALVVLERARGLKVGSK